MTMGLIDGVLAAKAQRTIRILIADDHPLFRAGVRRLLEAEGDFSVVGETGAGDQVADLTRRLAPDILLLDIAMPDVNGLDVLHRLHNRRTSTRIVLLTASITPAQVTQALSTGAAGVLMKTAATELLYECIRSVANGQYWVGRDTVGSLIEALATARSDARLERRPFTLTRRELEVIGLISEGLSNNEIAKSLQISEDTVKHHMSRIFDKTGTSSRVELALFAHHHLLSRKESL